MASEKKGNILEKLTPVLLIASIFLAFAVGVLWQKVQNLESGGVTVTNDAGSGNNQPQQAPSVLSDLPKLAESVGIDKGKFEECVSSGKYSERVENDYQGGVTAGITGTPGSFILNNKGEAWLIGGALPYSDVKNALDFALGKSTTPVSPQVVKLTPDKVKLIPAVNDNDHIANAGPNVYLIEYSDFQCPYCQRFHPTIKSVISEFKGEVAVVYRHFPLDQIHPLARPAAVASECVAELGGADAFWEFTDKAFTI